MRGLSRRTEHGSTVIRVILAFLSIVVILAVLGAGAWFLSQAGTPEIRVADQVGQNFQIAAQNLAKQGLRVEIINEPGPDTDQGSVVRMAPPAGSLVKPGRSIILYVVQGGQSILVPDLVGTLLIDAPNRLSRSGLDAGVHGGLIIGQQTSVKSDSPAGTILSQSPLAGTEAKPGSAVNIVIAVDQTGDRMPNLAGRLLQEAMDTMAARGYAITTIEPYYTTSRAVNTIMSQAPAPGTPLTPDLIIKVIVATVPASRLDGAPEALAPDASLPTEPPLPASEPIVDAEAPAPRPATTVRPAAPPAPGH